MSSPLVVDAVFDLSPDPVWLVSDGGEVVRHNAAFTRWSQRATSLDDALGEVRVRALRGRTVMTDVRVTVGGIERTFAVHAIRVEGAGVLFLARDLGELAALPSDAAIERALLHLFTSDERLADVLPKALEFLCTSDAWDAAIVWLRDGTHSLRPKSWWFHDEASALERNIPSLRFRVGHGIPGRTFATREVIRIADIYEESLMQRAELTAAAGLHSVIGIPLLDSDDAVGVLELFSRAVRPVSDAKALQLSHTGEALGRLVARRISDEERRRLLALVERKSAEWMLTFDSIALPIFLVASDGTLARLNLAARDLTGVEFDNLIGRELAVIGAGEPWTTLTDITTAVHDSGMPCTAQITSGERTWDVSASLLDADPADDRRVIIVLHETTQLIKLQESVRRGEQLAALGELVAGVAHEVKNPIFGMGMSLDLLERMLDKDDESVEMLNAMRTWLQRLSALTENLLEYGKTWTLELKPGDVDAVIEQAIEVCRPRATEAHVAIECEGTSGGATVLMDATRLAHVFENLLTNAIQFSPRDGAVTLTIGEDDDAVEFTIRDRGPGFNLDDLPRLWQPFFTRRRGGTGLGLAIVQRIVDEHGGTVNASNHKHGGAMVRVRLPKFRV